MRAGDTPNPVSGPGDQTETEAEAMDLADGLVEPMMAEDGTVILVDTERGRQMSHALRAAITVGPLVRPVVPDGCAGPDALVFAAMVLARLNEAGVWPGAKFDVVAADD